MARMLDIEVGERKRPILCIFGEDKRIQERLVKEYTSKFRIIIVGKNKPSFLEESENLYFITLDNSQLLPKLQEIIDYAIVFLDEEDNSAFLSPLIEKIKLDVTQTVFIVASSFLEKNVQAIQDYQRLSHATFAILGEVMSRKKVDREGVLSKITENAIAKGEIRLSGNESFPVFTISTPDLLSGVSRILFGSNPKNSFYFLFYLHPQTVLEATHIIGRVEPDIKIVFSDTKQISNLPSHNDTVKFIAEKFGANIKHMDATFEGFEKGFIALLKEDADETSDKGRSHKNNKKAKRRKGTISTLKFVIISLFFGTFLFLFINLFLFGLGLFFLRNTIDALKTENLANVSLNAKRANFLFATIRPATDLSLDMIEKLDSQGKIQSSYKLVERAGELSEIIGNTYTKITENGLSEKELITTLSNLTFLYQEEQRIVLETNNETLGKYIKGEYTKLLSFSPILPELLGYGKPQEYLLLFQNNEELRPTGGFIGSIGDASIRDGQVSSLTIQDVYTPDGQLKIHIEPPFAVRRYLQPHLYLRDSNFSLDYQKSASMSAYLYNLETGKKPNAVISIDLKVLQKILEVSGPIHLSDYNITVSSDTVSQFLQNTIQGDFFPGSTKKKDVLNSVFQQLILKFSKDQKLSFQLLQVLPELLEQKDILFSFSDSSIQKLFSANGYSGEYSDTRNQNKKSINDYLYVNEANIGVNKVNSSVTRKVSYQALLGQGTLESKATLTLNNSSKKDDYKSYITFVVPKGSSLNTISINGIKQEIAPAVIDPKVYEAKNFKTPSGIEVEQYESNNLSHFAFVTTTQKNTVNKIEVGYNNGAAKQLSTLVHYSFYYVKQPGTDPYTLVSLVDYPDGYMPTNTNADTYGKNFLEGNTIISRDFQSQIELHKAE